MAGNAKVAYLSRLALLLLMAVAVLAQQQSPSPTRGKRRSKPPPAPASSGSVSNLGASDFVLTVRAVTVQGKGKKKTYVWSPLKPDGSNEVQGYVWANLTAGGQVPVCMPGSSDDVADVACKAAGFASGREAAASATKGKKAVKLPDATFLQKLSCAPAGCGAKLYVRSPNECSRVVAVRCKASRAAEAADFAAEAAVPAAQATCAAALSQTAHSPTPALPPEVALSSEEPGRVFIDQIAGNMQPWAWDSATSQFTGAVFTLGVLGYVQAGVRSYPSTGFPALVPICADGFDDADASVICRLAGVGEGVAVADPSSAGILAQVAPRLGASPLLLSKLRCSGAGFLGGCSASWVNASECTAIAAMRCVPLSPRPPSPSPPSPKPPSPPKPSPPRPPSPPPPGVPGQPRPPRSPGSFVIEFNNPPPPSPPKDNGEQSPSP